MLWINILNKQIIENMSEGKVKFVDLCRWRLSFSFRSWYTYLEILWNSKTVGQRCLWHCLESDGQANERNCRIEENLRCISKPNRCPSKKCTNMNAHFDVYIHSRERIEKSFFYENSVNIRMSFDYIMFYVRITIEISILFLNLWVRKSNKIDDDYWDI